jgi:hypothetical protein
MKHFPVDLLVVLDPLVRTEFVEERAGRNSRLALVATFPASRLMASAKLMSVRFFGTGAFNVARALPVMFFGDGFSCVPQGYLRKQPAPAWESSRACRPLLGYALWTIWIVVVKSLPASSQKSWR